MVILDAAPGSAKNFLVSQELANVENPGYGGGLGDVSFTFGSQSSTAWTPVSGVPEPTSGILLMVGLGALALRRRKA